MNSYGKQIISESDIRAVEDVMRSDFLTQGPVVPAFESAVAEKTDAKYAVAVNSATSALHIACKALNVLPGDTVWTSPISFVASANCARYCEANVDFVDIDPETFNIDSAALEAKLNAAEKNGKLPKVIVVVHMCGQSPDMSRISELSKYYNVKLIEDASHAIGGSYQNRPVGSCFFSDITVFSFHPVKIITTAEGGMALTNDADLASRMSRLRSHGVTRDQSNMEKISDGPWYYEQIELGWNYRMTEIQAALGLSQLNSVDTFVKDRRSLADYYDEKLQGLPLKIPGRINGAESAWHLYVIRLNNEKSHLRTFQSLKSHNIGVNVHYIPIHLQPYYRKLGFRRGDFPIAEDYYSRSISIPIHPQITSEEQNFIISTLMDTLLS
jgi:UDP-4-amino-4,6-dideoxy-N-acetyl-beta-L-altrosamine transaminase